MAQAHRDCRFGSPYRGNRFAGVDARDAEAVDDVQEEHLYNI